MRLGSFELDASPAALVLAGDAALPAESALDWTATALWGLSAMPVGGCRAHRASGRVGESVETSLGGRIGVLGVVTFQFGVGAGIDAALGWNVGR